MRGWRKDLVENYVLSCKLPLEVVRIRHIRIEPTEVEILAGSLHGLQAICSLVGGKEIDSVYLLWTEGDNNVARVSSSGLVFAFGPGETEVTAGDDKCDAEKPALIKVKPGRGRGTGDKHGRGFPKILVSEVDKDPDTNETVSFSREAGREHAHLLSCRPSLSQVEKAGLARDTQYELKRLLSSKAVEKYKDGRVEEITFYDACSFWGISPRSTAIEFEGRVANFLGIVGAMDKASQKKAVALKHGGETYGAKEVGKLLEVHKFLQEKFAEDIKYIIKRIDERK